MKIIYNHITGKYQARIRENNIISIDKLKESDFEHSNDEEVITLEPEYIYQTDSKTDSNSIRKNHVAIKQSLLKESYEAISEYILSQEEIRSETQNKALFLTKKRLSNIEYQEDLIIQAINSVDDIDKSINLLGRRLARFSLTYLPELTSKTDDNEFISKMLSSLSKQEILSQLNLKESCGVELNENEIKIITVFAQEIQSLYTLRKKLLDFIEQLEEETIPIFSKVAGTTISARLLAKAGSTEHLAKMPASTIQLLGAEKALFKHLTKNTKCPKYGVLYQHTYIQKTSNKNKGKMARLIADKLAIAIKIDVYRRKYTKHVADQKESQDPQEIAQNLLNQITERLKELNKD